MASIRLIHGEVNMSDRPTLVWKIQHDSAYEDLNQHVFLYKDWVHPNDENTWRDCDVLDAGSGPGIQVRLLSSTAKSITAVDLEAIDVSKRKNQGNDKNIKYIKDDIMLMDLGRQLMWSIVWAQSIIRMIQLEHLKIFINTLNQVGV
jgi:2-polyprenyl-3-methyl-5-hydroxy-6-metoxy-1,4-benzoquinol methylase